MYDGGMPTPMKPPAPVSMNETDEIDDASQHLRARIQWFVTASEVPRVIAAYSMAPKSCDACRKPIPPGSVEYDIGFSTLIFRLDADCYALWTAEMLRSSTKSQTA